MLRVLICEDDQAVRRLFVLLLEQRGFLVEEARDGVEALERIQEFHPDVIISDLDMPRLGGRALLDRVRSDPTLRNISFVLTSVNYTPGEIRVLDDTITLPKPFTIEDLESAVHRALYGCLD